MFFVSAGGVLTPIGAPARTGTGPCGVQFSPGGGLLATANNGGDEFVGASVSVFAVSSDGGLTSTGAPTSIGGRPCAAGVQPRWSAARNSRRRPRLGDGLLGVARRGAHSGGQHTARWRGRRVCARRRVQSRWEPAREHTRARGGRIGVDVLGRGGRGADSRRLRIDGSVPVYGGVSSRWAAACRRPSEVAWLRSRCRQAVPSTRSALRRRPAAPGLRRWRSARLGDFSLRLATSATPSSCSRCRARAM